MIMVERVMRAEFLASAFRRRGEVGLADLLGRCADVLQSSLWSAP